MNNTYQEPGSRLWRVIWWFVPWVYAIVVFSAIVTDQGVEP